MQQLIAKGLDTPVDFNFIRRVVGDTIKIGMIDHEDDLPLKPNLSRIYGKNDAVAVLLHVLEGKTTIGHWTLLIKAKGSKPHIFFDSLGLGLRKLYKVTKEPPKLLTALEGVKWQDSSVQLQRFGKHFRECGAFVSIRAKLSMLSNAAFVRLMKSRGKPDELAVLLVLLHYLDHEPKIFLNKFKRIKE